MANWELENEKFQKRISNLADLILGKSVYFNQALRSLIDNQPDSLHRIIRKSEYLYKSGIYRNSKRVLTSVTSYWGAGFLNEVIAMCRLQVEIWALTEYLTQVLAEFRATGNQNRLSNSCNEVFKSMQSFNSLPSSRFELGESINLRDEVVKLENQFPGVSKVYDNFLIVSIDTSPESYKYLVFGKTANRLKVNDNYTVYQKIADIILTTLEKTIAGLTFSIDNGLNQCGILLRSIQQPSPLKKTPDVWSYEFVENWLKIKFQNQSGMLILERQAVDNSLILIVTLDYYIGHYSFSHTTRCYVLNNRTKNLKNLVLFRDSKLNKIKLMFDEAISIDLTRNKTMELMINIQLEKNLPSIPDNVSYRFDTKGETSHALINKYIELFSW